MKIDKEVYKYIDYELQHYEENKRKLEELKDEILNGSPAPADGLPRGNATGNPTEQKALKLISSVAIMKIENTVNGIDRVYEHLNDDYKNFFDWNYIKNVGIVKTCQESNISEETYYRWRKNIVYSVGMELGIL